MYANLSHLALPDSATVNLVVAHTFIRAMYRLSLGNTFTIQCKRTFCLFLL